MREFAGTPGPGDQTHMDISQDLFYTRILGEKARSQDSDNAANFAQACAVKMHIDMDRCEEAVQARIFNDNVPDRDRDNRFVQACTVKNEH